MSQTTDTDSVLAEMTDDQIVNSLVSELKAVLDADLDASIARKETELELMDELLTDQKQLLEEASEDMAQLEKLEERTDTTGALEEVRKELE